MYDHTDSRYGKIDIARILYAVLPYKKKDVMYVARTQSAVCSCTVATVD